MANLVFDCVDCRAERYAAAPTLSFTLRIAETTGATIHTIALRTQIRIEPQRRSYTTIEQERLVDLFGEASRWRDTLKPIQFSHVATMVPGFTGAAEVELPVPCTYDLEVASARYLSGLDDDVVPLLMLFSGTVFLKQDNGFSVEQVPWSAETTYRLPVRVWRDLVDQHFPNSGWIRLSRETLDELGRYKSREALPTWDSTVLSLLAANERAEAQKEPA